MGNMFDNAIAILTVDSWQRPLIDALWLSTVVCVLGLIATRWLRQPAARAWVLLIALSACVILPATNFCVRSSGFAVPLPIPLALNENTDSPAGEIPLTTNEISTIAVPTSHSTLSSEHISKANPATSHFSIFTAAFALNVVSVIWLFVSLLLLSRLITSAVAVRQMVVRAQPHTDEKVLEAVSVASTQVGLGSAPRVLVSDRITTPMVLAYFRPTLLIPSDQETWSQGNCLHTILTHELAHIRRRDGWTKLWVQMITVLIPLQPLVWSLRRSFFAAAEEACDDWAVENGGDPVNLAAVLTDSCQHSSNRRELLLAVGMSATLSRVLRLLDMRVTPAAQLSAKWQLCATAVAFLVCGGFAFAQLPDQDGQSTKLSQAEAETSPTSDEQDLLVKQGKAKDFENKNEYLNAYETYEELFEVNPLYYRDLVRLGRLLGKSSERASILNSARVRFKDQIDKNQDNSKGWSVRWSDYIACLKAFQDYDSAASAINLELKQHVNNPKNLLFLRKELAQVLADKVVSKGRRARPVIQQEQLNDLVVALENDPTNATALQWLVILGNSPIVGAEAKKIYDPELDPNPPLRVLNELAMMALKVQDYKNAIAFFERALKLDSRNPYLLNNLGYTYLLQGDQKNHEKGLLLMEKAIRIRHEKNPKAADQEIKALRSVYDKRGKAQRPPGNSIAR